MFHCHNLVHEDHEMMAAFNVTDFVDLGYDETSFVDPMDPRWRPRPIVAPDFTDAAIRQRIRYMASLQPYNHVDEIEAKLDAFWARQGPSVTSHRRRHHGAGHHAPRV
jgi:bilirubin oxidase